MLSTAASLDAASLHLDLALLHANALLGECSQGTKAQARAELELMRLTVIVMLAFMPSVIWGCLLLLIRCRALALSALFSLLTMNDKAREDAQ